MSTNDKLPTGKVGPTDQDIKDLRVGSTTPEPDPTPQPAPPGDPNPSPEPPKDTKEEPPQSTVDYTQIARTVAEELASRFRTPEPPKQDQPKFEFYKIKPEDVDKLVASPEEAAEFLNQILDNVRQEYAKLVVPYVQSELQRITGLIEPIQRQYLEAQAESLRQKFVSSNPDLKDWLDVAEQIAEPLLRNQKFTTIDEFMSTLAKETRQFRDRILKRVGSGSGSAPPPPVHKPAVPRAGARAGEPEDIDEMRAVVYGPQYR